MAGDMDIEVRVCDASDLARVRKETNWENAGNYFDVLDLEVALDASTLSLVACDNASNRIVGFLALEVEHSKEEVAGNRALGQWISTEMKTMGFESSSTLWVKGCSLARKLGDEIPQVALERMLKFTFSQLLHVQAVAFAVVGREYSLHKGLHRVIPKICEDKDLKISLNLTERSVICPKLVVRPARVEDHDDLVPVVKEMRSKFPDLSQLPDSVKPEEKFALARLIENDSWSVLVATVEKKIVGMMCLQEIEDLDYYQENFDLEMFDNLASVSEVEEEQAPTEALAEDTTTTDSDGGPEEAQEPSCEEAAEGENTTAAAEEGEADKAGENEEGTSEEKPNAEAEPTQNNPAAAATDDSAGTGEEKGDEPTEEEEASPEGEANEEEEFSFDDDDDEGEEENAKEEDNGEAAPEVKREPLAFAIKMFCMKEEYADQAKDFLQPAFDSFPTKDYCIVSLSHTSRVPSLFSPFSLATAATQKLSSDVLYVLHRYSLLLDFGTEKANIKDYNEIVDLLGELAEDKEMLESINKAIDTGYLFKAVCQGQIVGVCSVEREVDCKELMSNFQLSTFSETLAYRHYKFGELTTFVMNPVFAYQKRFFLSSVMTRCSITSLCFLMKENKPIADILDVFDPVAQRNGGTTITADYTLFALNQRDNYKHKDSMNSRVIVVGASNCGLSCLQTLLQSPQYQFTNLTLVTSDSSEGSDVNRLANEHAFLSQVRLISNSVVEIDRDEKQIYLDDETVLSYDILVLTSGVQAQIDFNLDPEPLPVVTATGLEDYLSVEDSKPKHAIVYGGQGEASNAMSTLDSAGIDYTYCSPETFTKLQLVEQIAAEMKIDMYLRKPTRMTLHSVSKGDKEPLSCSFVNSDGSMVETETSLLVLAHSENVNPRIFGCVNDSSIVYDGRLVVDGSFCTTDEFIFGGGTVAKFSRLYGGLPVEMFNSSEVGVMLAQNITSKCEQANGTGKKVSPSSVNVPAFKEPVAFTFKVAHEGYHVTYIATPPLDKVSIVEAPEGGEIIRSLHEGQLSILGLDSNGVVCTLCFCGPTYASPDKFKALMGLHVNYLGRKSQEMIGLQSLPCLLSYLTEAWADALYSDLVLQLRKVILKQGLPKTQSGLRSSIHHGILELVKENVQAFPQYNLPYSGY